jgi:hypothetical protein
MVYHASYAFACIESVTLARSLVVSVLPVPAGPAGAPPEGSQHTRMMPCQSKWSLISQESRPVQHFKALRYVWSAAHPAACAERP